MDVPLGQVTQFHRLIGEVVSTNPQLLDCDRSSDRELAKRLRQIIDTVRAETDPKSRLAFRVLMAIEELAEWIEAHVDQDMVAAADAWGDRMYVLLGDAVATGLPAQQIFEEIHRSNLTKASADKQTQKGTKPEAFSAPALKEIIDKARQASCMSCRYMTWMVGIGQGVQCRHPENQLANGRPMPIPHRQYSCSYYERKSD